MSTRLTKTMRQAIVRAVMADIPKVDYFEKERIIKERAAYRQMPLEVKAVYDKPGLHKYLSEGSESTSLQTIKGRHAYQYFRGCPDIIALNEKERTEIGALQKRMHEQERSRAAAEGSLSSSLEGFTTVKALRDAMPELAKYLPNESEPTKNLPAVTGVVDILKAAGLKL